jgi:dTDP-4-amino-4,6-dideoxygalactose transaminase
MYPHAIAGEPSIRPFLAEGNGPTPGAEELARDLVTLPTHVGISRDIAGMVATAVHEVFP